MGGVFFSSGVFPKTLIVALFSHRFDRVVFPPNMKGYKFRGCIRIDPLSVPPFSFGFRVLEPVSDILADNPDMMCSFAIRYVPALTDEHP